MKNLSIQEFRNLCNKLCPREFIISSDNQSPDDSLEYGAKYAFSFPIIKIHTNPSSICFVDKNQSYIKLSRIKHIKKMQDSLLGNVFDIICTGFIDPSKEYSYTIIMR